MPADTVREDLRNFLTSRRARLTPQEACLPDFGGRRQVSGLRRSEVAQLAAISVEYYTRLERGNVGSVSEEILGSLAVALQLDDVERAHLAALVRAANALHRAPDPEEADRPWQGFGSRQWGRPASRRGPLQALHQSSMPRRPGTPRPAPRPGRVPLPPWEPPPGRTPPRPRRPRE
ncbi:helix-turn-helix domain-containing protein [Streptomyces sp. NPDC127172]|uniref:helix-turn-helix domain-containing protein n=1 Tax=Streptomyces sp. NPDC127172 TaxID=3345382 RepID=UPI00363F6EFD